NAIVEGAYSSDAGATWHSIGVAFDQLDPATLGGTNPLPYTQVTAPSVAFDGRGNVYVVALQASNPGDGAVVLDQFNFTRSAPTMNFQKNVYQWIGGADGVTSPMLAVDAAPSSPPPGVPLDPHANNVYIAWTTVAVEPANTNPYTVPGFNPNRAEVI